jgi:predicted ribosomally synthesized peptide with SipW-like signal peptide
MRAGQVGASISQVKNYKNMKTIVTSLGMIVFVAAIVAGGTGAFFSDTETSTGNVFTAGAIDLKVDAQAHYAGLKCVDSKWVVEDPQAGTTRPDLVGDDCDGTWSQTDLGLQHRFFNIGDIKPGDDGENTISLHIDNNDAWMCADVRITENSDRTCVEPENATDAENNNCVVEGDSGTNGDLAQNLEFVAWNDNGVLDVDDKLVGSGDNVHQAGEQLLFTPGPASDVLNGGTLTIADGAGSPLPGGSTSYLGLAWCAGNMTASTNVAGYTCDGSTMGNVAQTDSMKADITFRVEQARNTSGFRCVRATN